MRASTRRWERLGSILRAQGSLSWMHGYTGAAAFDPQLDGDKAALYVSGRDELNRSMIGRVWVDLEEARVIEVEPEPVLVPGERGAFDENGVSYPSIVRVDGRVLMFYTGWMPTVLTPFQNHLGLAELGEAGRFERVSRAPILPRDDGDHLAIGSSFALVDEDRWHLWYTSFRSWGDTPDDPKHRYLIKYAWSSDGRSWVRDHQICIGPEHPGEHSICRPSVIRHAGLWHMWFCHRGDHYQLGYAVSEDGVRWQRRDQDLGISRPGSGWDSDDQCYPHVIRRGDCLYMVYSGNGYGRDGLGLARLVLEPA